MLIKQILKGTEKSVVKRSTDWANPAAVKEVKF